MHSSPCPIRNKYYLCVDSSCHMAKCGPGNRAIISGPHWGLLEWNHRQKKETLNPEKEISKRGHFHPSIGCKDFYPYMYGGWKERKGEKQNKDRKKHANQWTVTKLLDAKPILSGSLLQFTNHAYCLNDMWVTTAQDCIWQLCCSLTDLKSATFPSLHLTESPWPLFSHPITFMPTSALVTKLKRF